MRRIAPASSIPILCFVVVLPALAMPPPEEVSDVAFLTGETLSWSNAKHADFYNVYRGGLSELADGGLCHGHPVPSTSFTTSAVPPPGEGYFYVMTGENQSSGEGPTGIDSSATPRPLRGACTQLLRSYVQNRTGFGADGWSTARIASLGLQGYIDEQLDPGAIDESTNTELVTRLAQIEPPADIFDLLAIQVVKAVYSRRQLEQQYATFWVNHFNTDWNKVTQLYTGAFPDCVTQFPQCDPLFPARGYLEGSMAQYREMEKFRELAFNGNFRQLLEASSRSPAMIIYLDTISSAIPIPNENYPRELAELHTMGVDGGYTQADVEELARIFTGWTLCKKETANLEDPTAPCVTYYEDLPPGEIVATFVDAWHDCGPKVLFAGTPEQVIIPSTCGNPIDGAGDTTLALDAIAAHPSTKEFISRKILQRFVTDEPSQAMVDVLVAEWNDATNPHGVGDMREVLRAALALPEFLDPDNVGSKIKTPLEHFASAFRAIRGETDGVDFVLNYLAAAQHLPHLNPVPTGYPEDGDSWIDTTNTLTRQNFGVHMSFFPPPTTFGSDVIGLLTDNGVSTAPGNAEAIVDFLNQHLFAGRLSRADRSAALSFLNTDPTGAPSPYDDNRIRKTAGVMLGFAQFQEQ